MLKEYDVIGIAETDSGVALKLEEFQFKKFVEDFGLPVFLKNKAKFTIYNGVIINCRPE